MDERVSERIAPLFGKKCWQVRVGPWKSLTLDFGERRRHESSSEMKGIEYGEWSFGTYNDCWRVFRESEMSRILVGKSDPENEEELDDRVGTIDFGRLISIEQVAQLDLRIRFDGGFVLDFLSSTSGTDEHFHIFGPDHLYVAFSSNGKWVIARSDRPLSDEDQVQ